MEGELGHEVIYVLGNEWRISAHTIAAGRAPRQALEPAGVRLCLFQSDWMTFLEDFVDCDEGLERLNFVGKNWLPAFELVLLLWFVVLAVDADRHRAVCGPSMRQCQIWAIGTSGIFPSGPDSLAINIEAIAASCACTGCAESLSSGSGV